ncbi:PREDICTED: membrane protein of ER body-like protein [Lupinus angustifolius]|uniref:membrane protein of ER body-like protein n=1 Tax=Lupinus angustifolius TaxID=3871 RepID=UPI00092F2680|nr:PREDICTED: membrane protein of ER body-like protein [Lupinus angustifolius]
MGKMQLIIDQWSDEENEVEEVVLQRKRGIQRLSDTIEGVGLKQEINIILPASDSPVVEDYTSLNIVRSEIERVGIIEENDDERQEGYMERVFDIAPTHAFYCPNCNSCIRKVYIQREEWEQALTETIRCPSCFSFVIPFLAPIPSGVQSLLDQEVASDNALEILKSIVYGGLTQSLTSLILVTSASSADATILSIVALALANLISGLFIFVHNLGELKDEQHRRSENQTEASVDRYNELLGQRNNFYVHAFIAIISFIVFGLMPPLVYGFSFHENGDKDFKLAAVLTVSLLCITLLSIAKAYTQKSNTFMAYFKTVIYYVSNGAVGSVLSYLAGDVVKKLLEKVSWLEPSSNFGLHVQGMNVQKTEWSSY